MADILLDAQSTPVTPAAGQGIIYFDNVSKKLTTKNDAGVIDTVDDVSAASTAAVAAAYAADTYVAGCSLPIPAGLVKAQTIYYACFDMTKTAAGSAAATVIIRIGTAGTIADTARVTFTFGAGTAAIDAGLFEVFASFRSVGASGVLTGICRCNHHLAATGLVSTGASGTGILTVTSAAFDTTTPASFMGISFNGGGSFSGTNTIAQAYFKGI
jgi:hypothetical protein